VNIPAIANITPVDTTGAGDTFLGAFMVGINNDMSMYDSLYFANICAGLKTTKLGAQTGMPTLKEVKKYVKDNKLNFKINIKEK
jgi:ribokinase